ncbi:MAG: redoxin domain-containing protein [Bacteroidota bacterium]
MIKNLLFLIFVFSVVTLSAQLPDGSIAPDFTLTDYYGTEHRLYDYLDEDKTVILEIFAAHCPGCWNFHQTNILKNLYDSYGPEGTDELTVFALEHDQWNGFNAFNGIGDPWTTQGNWLEGTPYHIFNVEDPDRGVFDDYNLAFYPVVYVICPDKILTRISTQSSEQDFIDRFQDCPSILSSNNAVELGSVYFDSRSGTLSIPKFEDVERVRVIAITGQVVEEVNSFSNPNVRVGELPQGIYLFEIQTTEGSVTKKFFVE